MTMDRFHFVAPADTISAFKQRCAHANETPSKVMRAIVEREIIEPDETTMIRPWPKSDDERKAEIAANLAARNARKQAIIARVKAGDRYADIARDFGITVPGVSRVWTRSR
jgi:hypothetical protein